MSNKIGKFGRIARTPLAGWSPRIDTSGRAPVSASAVGYPNWVLPGAYIDMNFQGDQYWGWERVNGLVITRATTGTDLLYTAASGASYNQFVSGQLRYTPSVGILAEEARRNQLLNSTAPVTQTTGSLATGSYTLWVNGSGSALASGGTATITGASSATNGSPNTFSVTVLGTVTVTVTGSLNAFQLELGTWATSLIVTAGATVVRNADIITINSPPGFGSSLSLFGYGYSLGPNAFVNGGAIISADDGTTNNRIQVSRAGSTGIPSYIDVVGASTIVSQAIGASPLAPTVAGKIAGSFTANSQIGTFNATSATSSGASIPSSANLTNIHIGCRSDTTTQWNGYIYRIAVWPTVALNSATLLYITGS